TRPCVAPDPSDAGTRIFAEDGMYRVPYSPASYLDYVGSDPENSQKIFAEYGSRVSLASPDLIKRLRLIFKDRLMPAPGEKRGIRAKQQPLRPGDFERVPENLAQGQVSPL